VQSNKQILLMDNAPKAVTRVAESTSNAFGLFIFRAGSKSGQSDPT
jgi:hypothetical protein